MPIGDNGPERYLLRADRALLHEEGACLPLRSRHGQCRACEAACPQAALQVSLEAVTLAEACDGCGRCAAACPTEALLLPELQQAYEPAVLKAAAGAVIRLECRKVPTAAHQGHTVVMPCLGAVKVGQLLSYRAAGHAVDVVDRGWCQTCACACGSQAEHPVQSALGTAQLWLQAIEAPGQLALVYEPLPLAQRPDALPEAAAVPALDRRSFFRAALERPAGRAKATPMGSDGRAAYPADRRRPSPERERQLAALKTLGEGTRHPVPAEFFPVLHVSAECCDQRLCVALCPTAALSVADSPQASWLQLVGDRCIACGACERACPQGAITLQPFGGEAGLRTLFTHARLRCTSCGDAYTPSLPRGEDEAAPQLCLTCAKSQRFMNDARRQLFGKLN